MQVKSSYPSDTEAVMAVVANSDELKAILDHTLSHFRETVKVPGFRAGKVPAEVLIKHIDQAHLQSRFLEEAVEQLYPQAVQGQKLRPVSNPEISVKKFVPFNTLEFEATMPVVGKIKLGDYKKVKKTKPKVAITAKDITEVLDSLITRASDRTDVDRPAKDGDQVYIDFKGTDAKGKPVSGADGKDYPLVLGSKTFIPGFEEKLVGLSANDEKTFTLKFPKDYGVKALASKDVTFAVQVTKVQELKEPKLDDAFAAKIGPFKTLAELKADIKKQLSVERQGQADRAYENDLIKAISDKSTVSLPKVLVDQQIERIEEEEKRNIAYRGQTWREHLDEEGVDEEQHKEQKRPAAEDQLKASIVMAEIADLEGLEVTPQEVDLRIQLLKGQYQDPQMQAELDKPEARRDVAGRILSEKTIEKIVGYATKK